MLGVRFVTNIFRRRGDQSHQRSVPRVRNPFP